MLAYLIIMGTSGLGYLGAPWWLALLSAAALAAIARRELLPLRPGFLSIDAPYLLESAVHARIAHSLVAAVAAYVWGALVRLALGG
jgi:hypothetical protein